MTALCELFGLGERMGWVGRNVWLGSLPARSSLWNLAASASATQFREDIAPLVERCRADAQFTAELGDCQVSLCSLERVDDLAVGET